MVMDRCAGMGAHHPIKLAWVPPPLSSTGSSFGIDSDVKGPGAALARPRLGRVRWKVPFWQDPRWMEHNGPLPCRTNIQTRSRHQKHTVQITDHSMNDQQAHYVTGKMRPTR